MQWGSFRRGRAGPVLVLVMVLSGCGADAPVRSSAPAASAPPSVTPSPSASTNASAVVGDVLPAPGSSSEVYAPNPAAIVVAIEAGHGGCLDWGVPDPKERGPAYAEKAITMAIADALAAQLAADGVTPALIRDGDEAFAGDLYPKLGCEGDPFRDVNGDDEAGFGPDVSEATRTRDELQARLDRANLAGADVLVSLHVDSITDASGEVLPIARTETFYTDETPWGIPATESLAFAVQESLFAAMGVAADYERQDRGINAHNLYIVAPPLFETTPDRPDLRRQPTRGALMPALLAEVGSITLPEEHELLLSDAGTEAAARGIRDGLAMWFGQRQLAGRVALDGSPPGELPEVQDWPGLPFVAPPIPDGRLRLRVTNTGTQPWDAGARLLAAAVEAEGPYLYGAPDEAAPIGPALPALDPGASVVVEVDPGEVAGGSLAWFSLLVGSENLADHGSPALQLGTAAP